MNAQVRGDVSWDVDDTLERYLQTYKTYGLPFPPALPAINFGNGTECDMDVAGCATEMAGSMLM